MPIKCRCDCGRTLAVKEEHSGKIVHCPACHNTVWVPRANEQIGQRLVTPHEEKSLAAIDVIQRMPEPIKTAVEAYCKKHKVNRSNLILKAVCDAIGKPELMDTVRPANRPKSDE